MGPPSTGAAVEPSAPASAGGCVDASPPLVDASETVDPESPFDAPDAPPDAPPEELPDAVPDELPGAVPDELPPAAPDELPDTPLEEFPAAPELLEGMTAPASPLPLPEF